MEVCHVIRRLSNMLSIIISCLGRKDSGGNRSLQEQETLRTQEQEQNRRFQEREKRNRKSKPHRWESATLVTSRWKKVSPPKGGVFLFERWKLVFVQSFDFACQRNVTIDVSMGEYDENM